MAPGSTVRQCRRPPPSRPHHQGVTMSSPARILIVGCGFGGFHAARALQRRMSRRDAEITVVSPAAHLLYTPLLPEVAGGVLDPRDITVPLTGTLRSRLVLGRVLDVDLKRRV